MGDDEQTWEPGRASKAVLDADETAPEPAKRGRGRPRTRPVDEERKLILDAAILVLGENGYGGATIEAVARRAGVQRRSVYEQFHDKDTLFVAAIDETLIWAFGEYAVLLAETQHMDFAEFLRLNARRGLDILGAPSMRAVLASAFFGGDEPTSARARKGRDLLEDAIAASISERFAGLGIDDSMLVRLNASGSVGLMVLMGVRVAEDPRLDPDRVADYLADVIYAGLLHMEGPGPDRPAFTVPRRATDG